MKIKLTFYSERKIFLPKGYFSQIQGLIYNLLDKLSADWLHTEGFKHKNRFFKLFVFSEINERGRFIKDKGFVFPNTISFYLASPINWILEQVAKNGITNDMLDLGENKVSLSQIETFEKPKLKDLKVFVRTLSPIEVHSTLKKPDGSDKTYYYNPKEKEFSELIESNLKKKWEILNEESCPYGMSIEPYSERFLKEKTIIVKDTVIKGWKGRFILEGDIPLLELAFETGLGTRNSLGFGFIEEVKRRER